MISAKPASPSMPRSRQAPMKIDAVARIYRASSLSGSGQVPRGGFESRAARAAARNTNPTKR